MCCSTRASFIHPIGCDGVCIEIKKTTTSFISMCAQGTCAERLIVVKLDPISGVPGIVYDGPAKSIRALAGPPAKNGQRRRSLSRLLNDSALTPEE